MTWTAAELTKIQILRGDLGAAVQTMEDPSSRLAELEPDSSTSLLVTQTVLALAMGDRATALERAGGGGARAPHPRGLELRGRAGLVDGQIFGEDAVGGAAVVADARDRLEAHHWSQALLEPELIVAAVPVSHLA